MVVTVKLKEVVCLVLLTKKRFRIYEHKGYQSDPEVFVEIYFDELSTEISSNFNIEGKHNSQKIKAFGLSLKIIPNQDYIAEITSVLNDSKWTVFPFEFYRVEFLTFSGKPIPLTINHISFYIQ